MKPESVFDEMELSNDIIKKTVTNLKTMRYFELCVIGKSKRHTLFGLSDFCARRNRLMVITKAFKQKNLHRTKKTEGLKRVEHMLDILELF
jgi:hypothetical protein